MADAHRQGASEWIAKHEVAGALDRADDQLRASVRPLATMPREHVERGTVLAVIRGSREREAEAPEHGAGGRVRNGDYIHT